jgi:hypothetical protein
VTEPWCWICEGDPADCPYNCGELVKRDDEQLDLFEDDAEDSD